MMRFILMAEPTMLTPLMKIPLKLSEYTYQAAPAIEAPRTIARPIKAQKFGSMQ